MKPAERRPCRRGQVLVLMAAVLPVLCIIAAATVDVGYLCATQAQLQNAADAAAVAAVMELWESRAAAASEGTARSDAVTEASTLADLNHNGVLTEVAFGTWDESTFTECTDTVSVKPCA